MSLIIRSKELVGKNPPEETIVIVKFNLTIEISKDGVFKLIDVENENLGSQIPNFNNIIREAVDSLPKAIPAVKTNVGVYVATKFTLPIELKTLD